MFYTFNLLTNTIYNNALKNIVQPRRVGVGGGGGGYLTLLYTWEALTRGLTPYLLYTIFDINGTTFVFFFSKNGTPFTYYFGTLYNL